jgi:hypothetical protein
MFLKKSDLREKGKILGAPNRTAMLYQEKSVPILSCFSMRENPE